MGMKTARFIFGYGVFCALVAVAAVLYVAWNPPQPVLYRSASGQDIKVVVWEGDNEVEKSPEWLETYHGPYSLITYDQTDQEEDVPYSVEFLFKE